MRTVSFLLALMVGCSCPQHPPGPGPTPDPIKPVPAGFVRTAEKARCAGYAKAFETVAKLYSDNKLADIQAVGNELNRQLKEASKSALLPVRKAMDATKGDRATFVATLKRIAAEYREMAQ